MLARMGFPTLLKWMAYSELEPWDESRADLRSAQVVAAIANSVRDPKKRPKPFTEEDFILRFGDDLRRRLPSWVFRGVPDHEKQFARFGRAHNQRLKAEGQTKEGDGART